MNDEFYVGYHEACPPGLARLVRRAVAGLAAIGLAAVAVVAAWQHPVDTGRFEFGTQRRFEGVLYETPLPVLRITYGAPPGAAATLLLVGAGKHGLPAFARGRHGKKVRFLGTVVSRQGATMIEMNDPASFEVLGEPAPGEARGHVEPVGEIVLTGELVDTKCFFGVMRPAAGKVHRGCAVRCLSGGVPPGLLVRQADGSGVVVLLAGVEGQPLVYDVQWAARVVEARGVLELHEDTPVLRARALRLVG